MDDERCMLGAGSNYMPFSNKGFNGTTAKVVKTGNQDYCVIYKRREREGGEGGRKREDRAYPSGGLHMS